ncbi:MAG TPA: hypothetical protein PKG60_03395 [Spirochaetota bacterium]|nr:hypothetical protein [Spirochaetota bacterium]
MKRPGFSITLILLIMIAAVFPASAALTVDVTFSNTDLQTALGGPAGVIATQVSGDLAKYSDVPDLARGFGNASAYSSHASTLRGYQGYDLFAISVGSMVAVQAPNDDPQFYKDLSDELDTGDVYGGIGVTPFVAQAGLNLGFILDGLYLSFMFGKFHVNIDEGDFKLKHDENLIGFNLTYQLVSEKSILAGLLLWRGLSIQSGVIHYNNITTFYNELDEINGTDTVTTYTVSYTIDPSVDFEIETQGNIIPVEIYTGVRIFYVLNIGVGGGFDYVLNGKTDITLKSAGNVVITDDGASNASGYVGDTGKITVDAGTSGIKSDRYRPKLLVNIGFGIGPVFIDFPVSYYLDNGYAVGVTAGCVW